MSFLRGSTPAKNKRKQLIKEHHVRETLLEESSMYGISSDLLDLQLHDLQLHALRVLPLCTMFEKAIAPKNQHFAQLKKPLPSFKINLCLK